MSKLIEPENQANVALAKSGFDDVSDELYEYAVKFERKLDHLLKQDAADLRIQFSRMIFKLGFEFFKSGRLEAKENNIVGLASAIRSGIENCANLKFILGKSESDFYKRAEKYVASYNTYDQNLIKSAANVNDTIKSRRMKEMNPWTSSSILDRVSGENEAILSTYDWMSHFAHPNPGILNYYWEYDSYEFHCSMFSAHSTAALTTTIQRIIGLLGLDDSLLLTTKVFLRKISESFDYLSFIESVGSKAK